MGTFPTKNYLVAVKLLFYVQQFGITKVVLLNWL